MTALLIGSALAVAGLAYVLWPVLQGAQHDVSAPAPSPDVPPEASAIEALREIEFDQATGKISAEDYAALKASYTPRALEELRMRGTAFNAEGAESTAGGAEGDPAEALVRAARARAAADGAMVCPEHGSRPEPDAVFCSDCGRYLGQACITCGARVLGERARFCTECGASLAA